MSSEELPSVVDDESVVVDDVVVDDVVSDAVVNDVSKHAEDVSKVAASGTFRGKDLSEGEVRMIFNAFTYYKTIHEANKERKLFPDLKTI